MAILVTGGAGYIGSHTILELIANGYDIVCLDNFSNSKPEAIKRVQGIAGQSFPFYQGDVRDEKLLDSIFEKHSIECVIHFAGLKAVGESVAIPLEYYSNNLFSTISLCNAMKRHNITKFIFSSSATVYSGDNEMPLTENSKIGNCSNPYGWTKYMQEQILTDVSNAASNWSVVLLRYFNPIGAHQSGLIGEDPQGIPNNLMPYIVQVAVGRHNVLNVNGTDYPTPDGTCIRDYIHVLDLARGHVAAIKYCQNFTGVEAFNLGTGRGTSVFEMISEFESSTGVKIPQSIVGRRPGDLPVGYAAIDKARQKLNWVAEKTVAEACADSWRWQKNNPQGFGD